MKDIFGNDLKPGDYFTYTVTQKHGHVRIGRVLEDGETVKTIAASAWNTRHWSSLKGRPNETVLVLDSSAVPADVRGLLA
jgi:hypothetical protein